VLILTRRKNERVFIGDDITLVVLGIENNRIKLGVDAPSELSILREEIAGRKTSNARKAANDTEVDEASLSKKQGLS